MPVYGCDFGHLACLVGWTYLSIAASAFPPVFFLSLVFFSFPFPLDVRAQVFKTNSVLLYYYYYYLGAINLLTLERFSCFVRSCWGLSLVFWKRNGTLFGFWFILLCLLGITVANIVVYLPGRASIGYMLLLVLWLRI